MKNGFYIVAWLNLLNRCTFILKLSEILDGLL